MKKNLAKLNSIYKPRRKRKPQARNSRSPILPPENTSSDSLAYKKSPPPTDSDRSTSVVKAREELRKEASSVEPRLPFLKVKDNSPLNSSSCSFENEFNRLESLFNRNYSARNDLLSVQKRIVDLNVKNIIRNNRFNDKTNVSLEDIRETLNEPGSLQKINEKSRIKLPKI